MTRPNPAIFASAYHPHVGGVEELVRQLAAEQRRRGDDTIVVTHRWPKSLPREEKVEGTPVLRESFRAPATPLRHWGGFLVHHRSTSARLLREMRDRGVDLVHVQCVSNNGLYAHQVARKLQLPLVVTMQGELSMDATGVYQRSAHLRWSWRRLLAAADVITACSRFSLEEAEDVYGEPFGERGHVIPNGIRLQEFVGLRPEMGDRPYVLGLGRMVPQKGFDLLLQAFLDRMPDVPHDLILAGDGPARPALEARAQQSGHGTRVKFTGSVDHARALRLFAGSSAFVLASRHEPQGIVVLEAMAAGAPVIAAAVGGVPELVRHEENGLLFRGGDSRDLGHQLDRLLQDQPLADRLRAAGRTCAAGYDWSRVADEYDRVYEQAMHR